MNRSDGESRRLDFLKDERVRALLGRLLEERRGIVPRVGADGRFHYEPAEEVLGSEVDIGSVLDAMAGAGILRKTPYKEVAACPIHTRVDPLVEVECVKCGGRSHTKKSLAEHPFCGHAAEREAFERGDGTFRCPKCGRAIRDPPKELRFVGFWYQCNHCATRTSTPRFVLSCREGPHDFSAADLTIAKVYTYELESTITDALKSTLLVAPAVARLLSGLGFEVSSPSKVRGQSGTEHHIDVYAKNDRETVAVQVVVDTKPVGPDAVISFFAKVFDIKPSRAVLVAIPSAVEGARRLVSGYSIDLIEDEDGSGVVEKMGGRLAKGA